MEKSFATDDHGALIEAAGGRAFQFFERSEKLTKSASDAISRQDMQAHMPPDTHFGVHMITMGAEEDFGANRNGDSASRAALEKYHPTFEKFGCVFREHKNKCQKTEGIGQVKLARYNPVMKRGELITWVEKDKAPDMYKAAKDGKELSWSMSMRLPHDECSCCKNKAKRTSDYCKCLKNGMLRYNDEFKKFAYARNEDDVKFFDISEVKRRADRIATYLGYSFNDADGMAKAASADTVITGAQWAEFHGGPSPTVLAPWEAHTLTKLAAAEQFVRSADAATLQVLAAARPAAPTQRQIDIMARPDFRSLGGEMAKRAMILDFATFASIITNKRVEDLRKEAEFRDIEGLKLPSLLSDMDNAGGCCHCGDEAADAVAPDEYGCAFSPEKDQIDTLLKAVGDDLGMTPQPVQQRAITIVVKSAAVPSLTKRASFDPFYTTLAEAYGYYLVKAAHMAKDAPGVSENILFREIAAMQIFRAQKDCQEQRDSQ
jgi:hypothetical protein